MTPKEKATELFNKYILLVEYHVRAQECAIVAVDQIIQGYEFDSIAEENSRTMDNINFWDKVKQEIEAL